MATSTSISIYDIVSDTKSKKTIPFDLFLENIRDGKWQDIVLPLRAIKDKKQRDVAKKKAPSVTVSGKFLERVDGSIETHSGFIGIDIDNVEDIDHLKEIICCDKYIVSAFTSISGRGVCLIFKINADRHREAFQGISEYLYSNYKLICDPTSINVSRARFVSYDPDIYIASQYEKFTKYPKNKPPKKIDKSIYSKDDFGQILEQVVSRRLNLCENYHEWLRIGFAFVHQFNEQGREYFHIVSQYSSKYDSNTCDKQFNACLKHKGNNHTTISTFYYYCKQAGISLYTERTRKIAYTTANGKKAGLNEKQIADNLKKFEDIEDAEDVIKQVFDNDIHLNEDTLLDQLELWVRQNYNLQRNSITRYIENDGKPLKQSDFNSIFIKAKKIYEKLNYELMDRLINSDFITEYNPFLQFFEQNIEQSSTGHIDKLFSAIKSNDDSFVGYFGKKWLVGIISAIHGEHSPLLLVLSGDQQGTGKTEFFRRLLPKELQMYYAESKLDAGKDDEILMTQKVLIMDDEMGGKSKKENKRLKDLTSKQVFSLREPYGRNNVDLIRLAVLCGTTNDNEVLSDPTGNRRIIPIHVDSIDYKLSNSVDRVAVFMEAYHLFKAGFQWQVVGNEDKDYLNKDKGSFEVTNLEAELIQKYFEVPDEGFGEMLTASEIKVIIEDLTHQKLLLDRVGKELKRLGFVQKHVKNGKTTKRIYFISRVSFVDGKPQVTPKNIKEDEDLPF